MDRLPLNFPESRLNGATPTSADGAAIGVAQFGQFGDEGGAEHRSDARHRTQLPIQVLEVIVGIDQLADLLVQRIDLPVQRRHDRVDGMQRLFAGGGGTGVVLLDADGGELAAAGDQRIQLALILRALLRQARLGQLGELHQHPGVDPVGLGQDAATFGEVSYAAGMDQGHWQPASSNASISGRSSPPVDSMTIITGAAALRIWTMRAISDRCWPS